MKFFFSSTIPSSSILSVKMVSFWFFLWSFLIPILITVISLMGFLLYSKNSFFITGMEYVTVELFLVMAPMFILSGMVKDSLTLLYLSSQSVSPEMIIKVVGSQWYWNYEISDLEEVSFTSYMKSLDDLSVGDKRFLEVDNRLLLPISVNIQSNVTSSDVIHSFSVPTLGVKVDAASGILNILNFTISKTGVFVGQCSEICGMNHSYMPIMLEGTLFIPFYYWVLLFIS